MKLRNMENNLKEDIKKHIKIWVRYVDNILAVLKPPGDPHLIWEEINLIDSNIKFTFELENNNTLNILDVKIIKGNYHFQTLSIISQLTNSNEIVNKNCRTP